MSPARRYAPTGWPASIGMGGRLRRNPQQKVVTLPRSPETKSLASRRGRRLLWLTPDELPTGVKEMCEWASGTNRYSDTCQRVYIIAVGFFASIDCGKYPRFAIALWRVIRRSFRQRIASEEIRPAPAGTDIITQRSRVAEPNIERIGAASHRSSLLRRVLGIFGPKRCQ